MAKKVQELECWRLSDALRKEVHAVCAHQEAKKYYRFCDGFTEAAGSVCRNISEGFRRGDSGSIVQFFGYALGSLGEVDDYLHESLDRKFIDKASFDRAIELVEHARAKSVNFRRYHQEKLRARRRQPRPPTAERA